MFYSLFWGQLRAIQLRQLGKPLKTVSIAILLATLLSTVLWGIHNTKAYAQAAANTISIQSAYVTDSAQNPKSSFKSGEGINYHIDATNSSGQTLSVSVMFFASATIQTPEMREFIIINKTFNLNMPAGPSRFYTPSTIPAGVVPATYQLGGSVYQNSDRSNSSTATSNGYNVTRVLTSPLKVPYFSQFDDSLINNECGETAVAMAAGYYADLYDTPKAWITAVRNQIGVSSSDETDADQLKSALWGLPGEGSLQGMQITVTPLGTSINQVVQQIQTATQDGFPVIVLVNGNKLNPPRSYTGHWIVITGISGNTVYVNDPDSSKGGTGQHNPTQMSLSVYKSAAISDALQGYGQTDGLIVTGEDFQSP
jgi:hypothetical protein